MNQITIEITPITSVNEAGQVALLQASLAIYRALGVNISQGASGSFLVSGHIMPVMNLMNFIGTQGFTFLTSKIIPRQ